MIFDYICVEYSGSDILTLSSDLSCPLIVMSNSEYSTLCYLLSFCSISLMFLVSVLFYFFIFKKVK
jgi:hypothetical protein